jgi:hypothetical protein
LEKKSMSIKYNILVLGASYGSLLASKILFAGHSVKLVCLPAEPKLINAEGFRVRMSIRGRKDPASAARALSNGAPDIERADKLVQLAAKQKGMSHSIFGAIHRRLEASRMAKAAGSEQIL